MNPGFRRGQSKPQPGEGEQLLHFIIYFYYAFDKYYYRKHGIINNNNLICWLMYPLDDINLK
jgi:hypothetical protein